VNVSQRLYLAVIPGIIGVFTVAGLAYWGQYDRQAPQVLVIIAVVASVVSFIVAWRNTRYVATRVSRLAAPARAVRVDELDAIEEEVERLRRAVLEAEATETRVKQYSEAAIREYSGLVADTTTSVARQLDEVRMPLHILLDNHFGDLNDNQEEMLAAARGAADAAQSALDRLREIADVDRGAIRLRSERVRLGDLVAALMPGLVAEANRAGVRVSTDFPPSLPAVAGDRARLGEAVSLLAADCVRRTPAGGEVRITGAALDAPSPRSGEASAGSEPAAVPRREPTQVQMVMTHGALTGRQTDVALADRLLVALGGRVDYAADRTAVTLPAYAVAATVGTGTDLGSPHTSR
jgi:signal transduction histidine kinase